MKKKKIIAISLLALVILLLVSIVPASSALNWDTTPLSHISRALLKLNFKTVEAVDVDLYLKSDETVTVSLEDEIYFFDGPGTEKALIFYPGALIEYTAYAPLMRRLAEEGMDCFLVHMPMNLAFLSANRADDIIDSYSYEGWYLAGHSLGGAIIANYAATTEHTIDGLYLLAAYPSKDVKDIPDVLYIYGELDNIVDRDKIASSKEYAPEYYREYIISGGNHSQFGSYGLQDGDKAAEISTEEQIKQTTEQILSKSQVPAS